MTRIFPTTLCTLIAAFALSMFVSNGAAAQNTDKAQSSGGQAQSQQNLQADSAEPKPGMPMPDEPFLLKNAGSEDKPEKKQK